MCLVVISSLGFAHEAEADREQDTSVEATLSAARAFLEKYRTDLIVVIADEDTTQRVTRQAPVVPNAPRTRATKSEVHFAFISDNDSWMAVRNVITVDGVAPENRPDLKAALLNQEVAQVARTFKALNSQFNIGRLVRNFNEPTLALGVLEPKRASFFEFTRRGSRTQNGVTLVTLGFKERRGPEALIYDLLMRQAPVEGDLVIEAGTGRVHRTMLKVTMGSVRAEMTTTYERAPNLDLWVPVSFRESYEDGVEQSATATLASGAQYETVFCESRYRNFRQFRTSGRIK